MKKLFLMGRSEAGKTSLTQALKGEELRYIKTQYTNTGDDMIDSPGEYAESKCFGAGLACFSFEADVIAVVQAADEPYNLFGPSLHTFIQRPIIGIITKTDSPYANVPMIRQWMENAGCERIFEVNNKSREGIDELIAYLKEDLPKISFEEALERQRLGLSEWEAIPEKMNIISL
ncbi:ethanolamine utilization protein EutP [Lachnospiraceae bacterium]|nr:ethanolamine utilization protein EutP [Lachnospiraceae bacterium]